MPNSELPYEHRQWHLILVLKARGQFCGVTSKERAKHAEAEACQEQGGLQAEPRITPILLTAWASRQAEPSGSQPALGKAACPLQL